jgi:hypothetical protein
MLAMTDQKNSPDLNPAPAPKVPGPVENALGMPEAAQKDVPARPREIGGPKGPEPTRYGDWEVGGRCTDF